MTLGQGPKKEEERQFTEKTKLSLLFFFSLYMV